MVQTKNQSGAFVNATIAGQEELIPLLMPAQNEEAISAAKANELDADEEEFNSKPVAKMLLESLADDEGEKSNFNLSYILGGGILSAKWVRNQVGLMILLIVCTFAYITTRYMTQKQMIRNNDLREQVKEKHNDATATSTLWSLSSKKALASSVVRSGDTILKKSNTQPVVIEE